VLFLRFLLWNVFFFAMKCVFCVFFKKKIIIIIIIIISPIYL
jgi:hypothetical protein